MKHAFILPSLLLLGIVACKKPSVQDVDYISYSQPVVFATSLEDSLPAKTYKALNTERILGVKIKFPQTGKEVRYFEYNVDRKTIINELSKLPFDKYAMMADTLCRKVDHEYLTKLNINDEEFDAGSSFWNVDKNEYDVYECVKSPARHIILVSKTSNKVLHRIEYV